MTPRVLKKPQVERDLVEHFSYIARDKVEPAERFLQVAEEIFWLLASHPHVGQPWKSSLPQLAGVRVLSMPKAYRNYLIFYRPIDQGVEILTVIHGSRDLAAALERMGREE